MRVGKGIRHGLPAAADAVARAAGGARDDGVATRALAAARRVLEDERFGWLFDPARCERSWNEARLSTGDGGYGVVDRLVVTADEVWIVDYKTDRDAVVRDEHRAQLARYASLARALWPERTVRTALLFTAVPRFVEID